jgi:uroporphyrinogen decarboxylase
MKGRERLLTTLKGGIPDEVPVSLFVQEEFLSYMYPGRKVDRVKDAVECAKFFEFDIMTRSNEFNVPYFMRKSYPNWDVSFSTVREAGNYYKIFEVKTPLKTLKQVEVGPDVGDAVSGLHLSTKEYLIKDESDLEAFLKYVPSIDSQIASDMKEYCKWSKEVIGELGISAPWGIGGIYNLAATYRDVTQLMMDPYINTDFYEAYMNKLTSLAVAHDSEFAAANGDVIGIQGNIANAAVIGSDFFDEFILPYEKKLVEAISGSGSFTIYHNCGRAEVLQKSYVEMGLSAWETVAEAPQGDNSLERAKKNIGDKITLIGNLDQVNFLKTASVEEVEKKAEEIMNTGKPGGRYIFACSDFLEKDTPYDNVKALVRSARMHARY